MIYPSASDLVPRVSADLKAAGKLRKPCWRDDPKPGGLGIVGRVDADEFLDVSTARVNSLDMLDEEYAISPIPIELARTLTSRNYATPLVRFTPVSNRLGDRSGNIAPCSM